MSFHRVPIRALLLLPLPLFPIRRALLPAIPILVLTQLRILLLFIHLRLLPSCS